MTQKEVKEKIISLGSFENKTVSEIAFLINCSSLQKVSGMCYLLEVFYNYLKSEVKNKIKFYSTK